MGCSAWLNPQFALLRKSFNKPGSTKFGLGCNDEHFPILFQVYVEAARQLARLCTRDRLNPFHLGFSPHIPFAPHPFPGIPFAPQIVSQAAAIRQSSGRCGMSCPVEDQDHHACSFAGLRVRTEKFEPKEQ